MKTDENNKPLPDGYTLLTFISDAQVIYHNSNTSPLEHGAGFFIGIFKDGKPVRRIFHPWHRIIRIEEFPNSDDYIMAAQMFRDSCKHVWDTETHHLFEQLCNHECMICGSAEGLHDDDTDDD